MSFGSSGRYQSRIFNFVHQQSRRLTEQLEHTIRYVQVATKWGVEAILYPVYMWLHSSQSSERTLDGQPTQAKPQLEPQVDKPIVNVLETVKNLPFTDDTATPSNDRLSLPNSLDFLKFLKEKISPQQSTTESSLVLSTTPPKNQVQSLNPAPMYLMVRGIATDIEKRNLLLITADNEILDILTPQQQAKLEAKIISEIGNYRNSEKLLASKQETNPLPEIERLLAKLTGSNPPEISVLNASKFNETQDLLNYQKALTFIDAAVANLETKAIVPIQQRSQEMMQIAQTQLQIFLYGKEELAARGEITATSNVNFAALIEAALNYFLGVGNYKKLDISDAEIKAPSKRLADSSEVTSTNNQLVNQNIGADAWLTWSDLYGESEIIVKPSVKTPSSLSITSTVPQNLVKSQQKSRQTSASSSDLVQKKKTAPNISRNQRKSAKVTSSSQNSASISQTESDRKTNNQVEAKPDWIETTATFVSYEKHILQRILELLDGIMVWLETVFVNIMMFLRGFLGVK
ncbi:MULTISPECIES: hypothetical protein [Calothrix]|uniref:Uncharacterized protein n=2 Tax=Calothrix TaxID=1186 RepID=A0ABR8AGT6_9CYAN|nr:MULTISPECIES: hypothetical protein [Calothrix]MBD2197767.1 hypothetical protein [Calothrix parietina FACHB-288]MBD2226171.1 hypothetical protein [Calothrix anomala FACHB-343]